MKFRIIYPKWEKLKEQTTFNLPPHGPVVFAATLPDYVSVDLIDENVESIDFNEPVDFVGISVMLTAQIKRGWEIAQEYRSRGIKVIFGGIATMLHAEETLQYTDSIFLGETEGRMEQVINDFMNDKLKKVYNFFNDRPDPSEINPARRDILNNELYYHKGVRMVDLFHASRGCKFNCYPCCAAFLGGRKFRPRPIEKSIEELESIENNRLFIVDNSLAQDTEWEKELFREMIPLKKKWCCHTIENDSEVLDLAAQAGAWYVYQAVFDDSEYIRKRIKQYHDFGIGIEATILLGMDNQTEDDILRLLDFLHEMKIELAEFTVLTPFKQTKAYDDLLREDRIIDFDWNNYNAGKVVFKPKNMSRERLQELYEYAWESFYSEETQEEKMFKLLMRVIDKEIQDGTYRSRRKDLIDKSFGDKIDR